MENSAISALKQISEENSVVGWTSPLGSKQIGKKNNIEGKGEKVESGIALDLLNLKKRKKQKLLVSNIEIAKKLIVFKAPKKNKMFKGNSLLSYKKNVPTLPIKISPNKEFSMLLQNNKLSQNQKTFYSTVNLWQSSQKKVKCRHYTQILKKEEANPEELLIKKPNCFKNDLIQGALRRHKTIDCSRNEDKGQFKTSTFLVYSKKKNATISNSLLRSQAPLKTDPESQDSLQSKLKISQLRRKTFFIKNFVSNGVRSRNSSKSLSFSIV